MAIGTYELVILLTIEVEAGCARCGNIGSRGALEVKGAYADTSYTTIERLLTVSDACGYII